MNTIQLKWVKLSIISRFLWTYTKKIPKFIWRHLFTLYMCRLFVLIIIKNHGFHDLDFIEFFKFFFGAVILDWLKMFIKIKIKLGEHTVSRSDDRAIHLRQWSNPGVIGSMANIGSGSGFGSGSGCRD